MSAVAVFFGTRPEIIKLAPLIKLLGSSVRLVHTGQHFDPELSQVIFDNFGVAADTRNLGVGGSSRAQQIGMSVIGGEKEVSGCGGILVQGDTNSALAGALLANAMQIPLFHVEAGLRSYDRRMPEEHNRVLVDHLADKCWAPTRGNVDNLLAESIPNDRIEETGNSVVEALQSATPTPEFTSDLLRRMGLVKRGFILTTLHRPENVDDPGRLEQTLKSLAGLRLPVVFPMHPRTRSTIKKAGLEPLAEEMNVIQPLGYTDFLGLLGACALVVSDSGGIQEEVSVLKVPLVVLRRSTERPEALGTFATLTDDPAEMSEIVGTIVADLPGRFEQLASMPSPFGDGHASERMVASLTRFGLL
ncbi:UDP-N-acetylglucosamine 2-epimerase (non-hydrolyzing) [soil metagenome]